MNTRHFAALGLLTVLSRPLALVAVLLAALPAVPVSAQSESDLRRQNQELTTKVKDLEAELAAAQRQAEELQKRVAALEAALNAARSAGGGKVIPPLEEEKVTIDESQPQASPRALRSAIVASYAKATTDLPMGKAGDRERVAYMRALQKWKGAADREFRLPVEWHVRLQPASMLDTQRERMATFIAIDPVTGTRLGDEFHVALSRALATRLTEAEARDPGGMLVLKGTVVPSVRINPERESRGAFDNPLFIGPFAEYEFTVDANSITPPPPPAREPATQPASGAATPPTPAPEK